MSNKNKASKGMDTLSGEAIWHFSDSCEINLIMPSGLFYLNSLERSISNRKSVLLQCFVEIPVVNTNSVEPYQKPQTAATDMGIQCLPMLLLWDARHKWVNVNNNKLLHLKLTYQYRLKATSSFCIVHHDNNFI